MVYLTDKKVSDIQMVTIISVQLSAFSAEQWRTNQYDIS